MGGIIASGLAGFGGALQNVGILALKEQLDEQRQTRLAELQAKSRGEEQTRAGEIHRENATHADNLQNADRRAIGAEVSKYAQPREETLPPDQAGPVGTVTPTPQHINERGGLIASRMGRPDIAAQYRAAGEPGFREQHQITGDAQADRDARQAAAAKELKQTPPAEGASVERLREAQANYYDGAKTERDLAAAAKSGEGKRDKPKIIKLEDGKLVDEKTGALGEIKPGEPAKKGETRWLGPNDSDKPETNSRIVWTLDGKVLPGGLDDLYGGGRAPAGPAAQSGARPPSPASIQAAQDDPSLHAEFRKRYGKELADRYLKAAPAKNDAVPGARRRPDGTLQFDDKAPPRVPFIGG